MLRKKRTKRTAANPARAAVARVARRRASEIVRRPSSVKPLSLFPITPRRSEIVDRSMLMGTLGAVPAPATTTVGNLAKTEVKATEEQIRKYNLSSSEFDQCCGALHIYNFMGDTPDSDGIKPERMKDSLQQLCSNAHAMQVIILNQYQVDKYHDLLTEHGFHCVVKEANHPGYEANDLSVYVHVQHPKAPKNSVPIEISEAR